MKRFIYVSAVFGLLLATTPSALAAPAWGSNCLSCHDQLQPATVDVFGEDGFADPDESLTGAPDRGPLKVFDVYQGQTKELLVEVFALTADDTYAVTLKRLRFAGVEKGGELAYTGDCAWPEWGEDANYYTDPFISYGWGSDPTIFTFDIDVAPTAGEDYYDIVFAVAGKTAADGALFYAEEHFYLQVMLQIPGDLNFDGIVDVTDLLLLLANWGPCDPPPPADCPGDFNADGIVDILDFLIMLTNWS